MAASGLNPTHKDCINTDGPEHLCALVDFALCLRHKLEEINKDSFNSFGLRIGISCGPLVCGVIGARKPVFDIWGDTVNLASRMDSTGVIGYIQVPKNTAQVIFYCSKIFVLFQLLKISCNVLDAWTSRVRSKETRNSGC